MPLYEYWCPACQASRVVDHPMAAVDDDHRCTTCDAVLRRVVTPQHHFWPSSIRPGYEGSAQARLLDPEFQARTKDKVARMKEGIYTHDDFKR